MARVLVICAPPYQFATYKAHLASLGQSSHEVLYFNASRARLPGYLRRCDPDLVVFHYTFLMAKGSWEFMRRTELVGFIKESRCQRVVITADESHNTDSLARFIDDFRISHVFTFAPPQARSTIYRDVDADSVEFHSVLAGYIDERAARRLAERSRRLSDRTIDIGARLVEWPILGQFGQLKPKLIRAFESRGQAAGFVTDLSSQFADMLQGDDWFDFLCRCRYTLGTETGSSLLDRDGSVAARVSTYLASHENPSFEQVEAACFPGLDGNVDYRALAPRHLEAIMTRTCQVLVEGDYSGVLKPGEHYIELKRDFSNLDQVLELMRDEGHRLELVERAYRDIVNSGQYTYGVFAEEVLGKSLDGCPCTRSASVWNRCSPLVLWNRVEARGWRVRSRAYNVELAVNAWLRSTVRTVLSRVLGEDRLRGLLACVRGSNADSRD